MSEELPSDAPKVTNSYSFEPIETPFGEQVKATSPDGMHAKLLTHEEVAAINPSSVSPIEAAPYTLVDPAIEAHYEDYRQRYSTPENAEKGITPLPFDQWQREEGLGVAQPTPAAIEPSPERTAEPLLEAAPSSEPTRIEVKTEEGLTTEPERQPPQSGGIPPEEFGPDGRFPPPKIQDISPEEIGPASAETETGKENYRREAINPERILELKDKFDQAYSKELELHNIKTDEDKKKDPWLVESSAEHVRNKLLREYLKIGEVDWDQEELAEVRNDTIHMMSLSTKTLESLMLKPEVEEAATTPTIIEAEPVVITPEPIVVEPSLAAEATAETDEDEELIPSTEELPPSQDRAKSIFAKLKKLSPNAIIVWMQTRGAGRDKDDKPIVVAVASGEAPPDDPQTDEEKRKKRCWPLALGIGALALGAGYYLGKHGIPFVDIVGEGGGGGGSGEALKGVDLSGINPDTITAQTPGEFQQGVLDLLEGQGIHANSVTPDQLQHMNEYMATHDIASGMRDAANGLEQNVVDFPGPGGNFPNAGVSAEQGFVLGESGTGVEGLNDWVREAERVGITFTRGTS